MITIVGGGPGGRTAAVVLGQSGKEVTLIETSSLGGQCLRSGCMYVCGLIDAARMMKGFHSFANSGIICPEPCLNFANLQKEISNVQKIITTVLEKETKDAGVQIIYGEAIVDGPTVMVDGEKVPSDTIILSTGSKPVVPDIPGIDHGAVYTPQTLPTMKELPKRLIIIGGGVSAAEFAFAFRAFGSDVTLLTRSGFLSRFSSVVRAQAQKDLHDVKIMEFSTPVAVIESAQGLSLSSVSPDGKSVTDANAILLATGLQPRSESIQNIPKGRNGEVLVDRKMETRLRGIYACGDVTGPPCMTPVARKEGYVAAQNILGKPCEIDYSCIPQSISLSYDLSFCASDEKGEKTVWMPGPAGPGTFFGVSSQSTGLARITYNPETGRLASVESVAPFAAVPVSYLGHMMKKGIAVQDFLGFTEVHPVSDGLYGLLKYSANSFTEKK